MPSGTNDEINLKTGESVTITLKGLTTAGYAWNYTITGHKDCIAVSKELAPLKNLGREKAGESVDEVFTITAKKKGTACIHFFQRRSWGKRHASCE